MDGTDRVAAALDEISKDVRLAAASWANDRLAPSAKREAADELAHWAPRLLAAVEAVLELAREWEAAEPSSKARLDATGAGITRSHGSDVRRVIAGKLLGGAPGHG